MGDGAGQITVAVIPAIAGAVTLAAAVLLILAARAAGRQERSAGAGAVRWIGLGLIGWVGALAATGSIHAWPVMLARAGAAVVVGYLPLLLIAQVLYTITRGRARPGAAADVIVVLGSRLVSERIPPLLASRLDLALALSAPRGTTILVSGGGVARERTEADAMAEYLLDRGRPAGAILREDRSRDTVENLALSHAILERRDGRYRCVVVTSDFHVLRAAGLARASGVRGCVVGAPSRWPDLLDGALREFVLVAAMHRRAVALGCLVLTAAVLLAAALG